MNLWRGVVHSTSPLMVKRDGGQPLHASGATGAGLLAGDWVWVLQQGHTVLVLGKNINY